MIGRETLRIAWGGIAANKLRSGLTILGMTIGVASVIVLLASVIGTQLTELVANGPHYEATIERKLDTAHNLTIGKLDRLMGTAGQALQRVTMEPPQQQPSAAPPPASRSAVAPSSDAQAPAAMPVVVREPVPTPFELARRFLTPAISPLETAFIVFVVTIVILLQRDDLRQILTRRQA